MEDDDEFGDLYSDVLLPFQSSSSYHQPPAQSERPSPGLPIDLNVKSDDEQIQFGAHANPKFTSTGSQPSQTHVFTSVGKVPEFGLSAATSETRWNLNLGGKKNDEVAKKEEALAEGTSSRGSDLSKSSVSRVFGSGGDGKGQGGGFEDPNLIDESMIDVAVEERDHNHVSLGKDGNTIKNENFEKFDIEEDGALVGSQPEIPGLSVHGASIAANASFAVRGDATEGDDWDSDSDDDLQIVLNDNNHGPMAMEGTGAVGSDDEDGDPLVILADTEAGHQPRDDQEWGDNTAQATDGDRKELGDAARGPGGLAVAPKTAYPNLPYHPYHSQFKYVRPGAPPMPGVPPVGPAGVPGQIHPPSTMGPVAGRGRGEWRPMQKNFGYGQPAWGNNSAGRGFGSGLDFTLPSHKNIFEVDVDGFEDKPWRHPGVDTSDFFNFGMAEESWKDYCKQLEQLRLEASMQSKIRVYESGRTEQSYDPDLPPELAAAAAMHDNTSENANLRKIDAGSGDLVDGSTVRPPLPTGRPIQVEISSVERFPSIDTRPQRMRDADAIIEIVLQDSGDDSCPGNDVKEQPANDHSRVASRGGQKIDGDATEENIFCSEGSPSAYNDVANKRSLGSGRQTSTFPGRGISTVHPRRWTKGGTNDRSPNRTPSGSTPDRGFPDNRDDVSVKSNGEQGSSRLQSPVTVESAEEPGGDHDDGLGDKLVLVDGSSGREKEEMTLDRTTGNANRSNENHSASLRRQAGSSRHDQSSLHKVDDGGYKETSSENSKGRSGSSKSYQRMRDSADEEVVQHGHSSRTGNLKRRHDSNQTVKRNGQDERHGTEKHSMIEKDREGSYSRRDRDRHMAHHSHARPDVTDRRMEKEFSEGAWHRRDDDLHGRRAIAEGTRKQEYRDEVGSRYWDKIRENEKINRDESLQLRKPLDNGYSRGYQDKDVGSRFRERDDGMKSRYENMDDLHSKRRKEGDRVRRDVDKDDVLHGHKENTSRRKRERDEAFDMRKRDDQLRIKDDDHHSIKHKEDWILRERGERQRDRDEWHRLKQSQEESSTLKREREEGRVGVRSSRPGEDKAWASHARMKDEYRSSSDRDHQFKDSGRHIEHSKRRDRVEVGHHSHLRGRDDVHLRGKQLSDDDRRSRHEKASEHNDRAIGGSDNNRAHDRKHKEKAKKGKDSEGGNQSSMGHSSKRNQEDRSGQINEPVGLKGSREHKNSEQELSVNRHSSRKHTEDGSSEDELQNAGRGRSKLERWTSHKERDFPIGTKSLSSSLKIVEEIDKHTTNGGSSLASKLVDASSKTVEEPSGNEQQPGDQKDSMEIDNVDAKPLENKHLDTVEKLKKRSERFKLPMPSEKEALVIKKIESEPLPSAQTEARPDSEVKPERPPRKRRWISG